LLRSAVCINENEAEDAMLIEFKHLTETSRAPTRATEGAAGFDLYADLMQHGQSEAVIEAGFRGLVQTGIAIALPKGYVGMVCPRSGLALKHGITVLNAPGIIDRDYRGDVGVILHNASPNPFVLKHGDRIAQLVLGIIPYEPVLSSVDDLDATARGAGGFGSTGMGAN
jgi:dUTP pyrophosphatase